MTSAACTAGVAPGGGSGVPEEEPTPTKPTPSPTPTTTATTDQPPPAPPTGPTLDKTTRFDLTLDGESIDITKVDVKIDPGTGGDPARIVIAGSYEQQINGGQFTSTATFTIRTYATEKGSDTCGNGGRSANYFFKDTDGALRGLGTSYQGGNCVMNILGNASDSFSSGSAKGSIGGVKTKSFTLAWGQPLPKT